MKRILILAAVLSVGCRSQQDWQTVISTTRVEYGVNHGDMDPHVGSKDYDNDSYYIGVSIQPFAFLEPPKHVVVVSQPTNPPECK